MNRKLFNSLRLNTNIYLFRLAPILLTSLSLLTPNASYAADENSGSVHTVVAGDTLFDLAKKYLDDSGRWREFLLNNEIKNPRRLVPGSELHIPQAAAPSVTVIFTYGEVTLLNDNNIASKLIAVGDKLAEGTKVSVGNNSYLSIQFADGSIVRAQSNSVLQLTKVRESGVSTSGRPIQASRIVGLEHGNLNITVIPQPVNSSQKTKKQKNNTFEIVTPMAVAAVRGTHFDVSVSDSNTASGVTQGSVNVRESAQRVKTPVKHALLVTGNGISVDSNGKLGKVRPLLPAPDLSAIPTSISDAYQFTLDWPPVADASNYRVRIAGDADMHQVLRNITPKNNNTKIFGLQDGDYTLGIRAVDNDGIIGFESVRKISIKSHPAYPFYVQPSYRQTVGVAVKLECTAVTEASSYHLQVAKTPDFASPIIDADQLSNCSYFTDNLENGRYFWRVASKIQTANGQVQHGPFSKPSEFEVSTDSKTLDISNSSSVYWITESEGLTFTSQISKDETFSNIIQEKVLEQPTITLDNLPAGIYYIRLLAKDAEGTTTPFSALRMVEIKEDDYLIERTWGDKASKKPTIK